MGEHLGHATEMSRAVHREEEIDGLRLLALVGFLERLVQASISMFGGAPNVEFDASVDVLLGVTLDDEKFGRRWRDVEPARVVVGHINRPGVDFYADCCLASVGGLLGGVRIRKLGFVFDEWEQRRLRGNMMPFCRHPFRRRRRWLAFKVKPFQFRFHWFVGLRLELFLLALLVIEILLLFFRVGPHGLPLLGLFFFHLRLLVSFLIIFTPGSKSLGIDVYNLFKSTHDLAR